MPRQQDNNPIKQIFLPKDNFADYLFDVDEWINNLSKINILVGPNNSGKSRFLRKLFTVQPLRFIPNAEEFDLLNSLAETIAAEIQSTFDGSGIVGFGNIDPEIARKCKTQMVEEDKDVMQGLINVLDQLVKVNPADNFTSSSMGGYHIDRAAVSQRLQAIGNNHAKACEGIALDNKYSFAKTYIPVLRGLRKYDPSGKNIYKEKTEQDYFSNVQHVGIFTGLEMYARTREMLLGNLEGREAMAEYQKYLGTTFFDDQEVTIIPNVETDALHIKIGQEAEKPIHDLGDGLQSIIIITFPLFSEKNKRHLLFVEEPELYLHPGLQRRLLESLLSDRFPNVQVFFSTHSNHLLDITLDYDNISIYAFEKKLDESDAKEKLPKFSVRNLANTDNSVLHMLGVQNSSVYLSNCTIWVEGITDRLYLRHYLNLFQQTKDRKYREDQHFSFVEYGGGNVTHWDFEPGAANAELDRGIDVNRICRSVFLIADEDGEAKEKRKAGLAKALGDKFYVLPCREVENLISEKVLSALISKYEAVEALDGLTNKMINRADYKGQYLGEYIEGILKEKNRRGSYQSDSGTVSQKLDFCHKAIAETEFVQDFSEDTMVLCEKLYSFIKDNNA